LLNSNYDFLDSKVKTTSFNQLFEIEGSKDKHFYVFTQSNKKFYSKDKFNPLFSQVSISQFEKNRYFGDYQKDVVDQDLYDYSQKRQGKRCLLEYIPGLVQKIAFNQIANDKVAMVYRFIQDEGYQYRIRVYDLMRMNCSQDEVSAEKAFEEAKEVLEKGDHQNSQYSDFKLNTTSAVLALSMYHGDKIMLSMDPDIYKFRIL